jgi:hypothetical protein
MRNKNITREQKYIVMKFVSRCKCSTDLLVKFLKDEKKPVNGQAKRAINIAQNIRDNFVLKNYNLSDT